MTKTKLLMPILCIPTLAMVTMPLANCSCGNKTTITLDQAELSLAVGDTKQLNATVTPAETKVTWQSDKRDIATVDESGIVKAIAAGEAIITATANGVTATCKIKVTEATILTDIELETISLGQNNYTLTTDYIKVYAIYTKGSATDKVPLICGGLTGYTIKITDTDGTTSDLTSTFVAQGYKFKKNGEYTLEVSFEGYTKNKKITVSDLTIAITNNCVAEITFTNWTTTTATHEPGTEIAIDFTVTDSTKKIDPTASTITCGGEPIQDEEGVCYLAGKLIIPASLVLDDIELNLKLTEIASSVQNQTLEQSVTTIGDICQQYESGEITRDEFISSFTVGGTQLTSDNELIGSKINLTINGKTHVARIIDINHDDIYDTTEQKVIGKAALTFDMVTLLSDSDGNPLTSKWNTATLKNHDYRNSILMKNLTGEGSGTQSLTNTVLEMISDDNQGTPELVNAIKTVNKVVAVSTDEGSTYAPTSYQTTLFPLTYTEMSLQSYTYAQIEQGSVYTYWANHNANSNRIKYSCTSTTGYYWLGSPGINSKYSNMCGAITDAGKANAVAADYSYYISFAFCI